ncbi:MULTISPECIES: universal stress protein [unclassified Rhizobium]|uniref:universal stress protein n=1 Tax=unclassified Rhizobium TaxID=2613769 RepID=UPI00160CDE99|nr:MULTISPECIES: universal stress protein [unclassified Rhizobium]MBB3545239.1 nucleotide-binding universal stress UspA family protein [Rhizobium sp. BK399]MCS3743217.1 nucleotide-binding universal stress UspA family protein [Rhizobium sp. BK661]MCS4096355.1 nucleotide-binding universal stress UspA family protein [Rhizobium sp. BK176]
MRPQFHLPLITQPEATSFSLIENAIQFSLHQGAGLIASLSAARRHGQEAVETYSEDDEFQADRFDREVAAQLVRHLRERAERVCLDIRLVPMDSEAMSATMRLAELARAYDVTIVENTELARPIIEGCFFDSGRPLLLLPSEDFYGRIDNIAIAWDGSATVARALSHSYPMIQSATKATVIRVRDAAIWSDDLLDRYVEALEHSGIDVNVAAVHSDGEDTTTMIQDTAMEVHADLLIAGAYGHSKIREALVGGVTRGLLDDLRIPTLLSH